MFRDASLLVLLSLMLGALITSLFLNKQLGDDNPVEEVVEEIIDKEVGIDIDLTPMSKEDASPASSTNSTRPTKAKSSPQKSKR